MRKTQGRCRNDFMVHAKVSHLSRSHMRVLPSLFLLLSVCPSSFLVPNLGVVTDDVGGDGGGGGGGGRIRMVVVTWWGG